jgi:hypothetical protein
MQRVLSAIIGVILGALPAVGTEDHWATTYHVVPDPQGDGLTTMPIRFLTYYSSPETEINAVSEPDHLDHRPNSPAQDANLVSLYGIKVSVVAHSATTGTVVLVDLSQMRAPTNLVDAVSEDAVVSNTVTCVVSAAQIVVHGRLEIRIKAPAAEDPSKWQKCERVLELKKEDNK